MKDGLVKMAKNDKKPLLESTSSSYQNQLNPTEMYEQNKGLIISCARRFKPCLNLTEDDIVQIASLAFIKCINKFDSTKSEFSTFVWNCMSNAICSEIKRTKRSENINFSSECDVAYEIPDSIEELIDGKYLSSTEQDMLYLLASGFTGKEIQERLHITKKEFKKIKTCSFKKVKRVN